MRRHAPITALSATLLSVLACGGDDAPVIAAFTADRTSVGLGDRVQLSWDVSGATSIDVLAAPGGLLVQGSDAAQSTVPSGAITAPTVFTLTARNGDLSATAQVSVTVDGSLLRITRFAADPAEIEPGGSATLGWSIAGSPIGKVQIFGPGGAIVYEGTEAMGTRPVSPTNTTEYRLEVSNIAQTISATTSVAVRQSAPEILSFTAAPNPAPTGTRGTVTWQTMRADEVQISRDGVVLRPWTSNGAASGFTSFTFEMPTSVFLLEARNAFGTVSRAVTVMTQPRPVIELLEVTPERFTTATATVSIRWSVRDASTVELTVGGRRPTGFSGQAMGELVVDLTDTASVVLVGRSVIGDVTETVIVRRVAVFTQAIVHGEDGAPFPGVAVRVEDADGMRAFEGVTDANGIATIDIDAGMYPVSVSAAIADHPAIALVGLDAPTARPLRIYRRVEAPMAMLAPLEGTIYNKSALDADVVVGGDDVESTQTTGITYMTGYRQTNAPLSLVALDFGLDGRVQNATVTAPVARGGPLSVEVRFPRPARAVVETEVTIALPATGVFPGPGKVFDLGGAPVVRERPDRDDSGVLVGWGELTAAPRTLEWTAQSFAEPELAPTSAYLVANGRSFQLLAAIHDFGRPQAITVDPVQTLAFSPDGTRLLDARFDFDAPAYGALEVQLGDGETAPVVYRVYFLGGVGARIPRLPSTVTLRELGLGLAGTIPVLISVPRLENVDPWDSAPRARPDPSLVYAIRAPAVTYGLMGF